MAARKIRRAQVEVRVDRTALLRIVRQFSLRRGWSERRLMCNVAHVLQLVDPAAPEALSDAKLSLLAHAMVHLEQAELLLSDPMVGALRAG